MVVSRNGGYYALGDDGRPELLPQSRFDLTGYRVVADGERAELRERLAHWQAS